MTEQSKLVQRDMPPISLRQELVTEARWFEILGHLH
jgi:hypothetical protein